MHLKKNYNVFFVKWLGSVNQTKKMLSSTIVTCDVFQ